MYSVDSSSSTVVDIDINNKNRIYDLNVYYKNLYDELNNNKLIEELRYYLKNILKIELTEYEFYKLISDQCTMLSGRNFIPLILLLNEKKKYIEQYDSNIILQYMDIFTKNNINININSLSVLSNKMITKYQK